MTELISAIHVLTDFKCSQDVNARHASAKAGVARLKPNNPISAGPSERSGSGREPSQHHIEGEFNALNSRRLVGKFVVLRMDQHRGIDLEHHDVP
jgi:hypothetical protein